MARSTSPLLRQAKPRLLKARGVLRVELDRLIEVGDGAVGVALHAVGHAAVVEGHRHAGIELDRLVEVGDGAVEIALVAVGETAVVEGQRVLRVEL